MQKSIPEWISLQQELIKRLEAIVLHASFSVVSFHKNLVLMHIIKTLEEDADLETLVANLFTHVDAIKMAKH